MSCAGYIRYFGKIKVYAFLNPQILVKSKTQSELYNVDSNITDRNIAKKSKI